MSSREPSPTLCSVKIMGYYRLIGGGLQRAATLESRALRWRQLASVSEQVRELLLQHW